ncbi:hypothetical protein CTI14_70460, partial [Methylobacterium radiotolerans]
VGRATLYSTERPLRVWVDPDKLRGLSLSASDVINEIRRIPGVGRATLYSTERPLRVWVDPDKLRGLSLSASDV